MNEVATTSLKGVSSAELRRHPEAVTIQLAAAYAAPARMIREDGGPFAFLQDKVAGQSKRPG